VRACAWRYLKFSLARRYDIVDVAYLAVKQRLCDVELLLSSNVHEQEAGTSIANYSPRGRSICTQTDAMLWSATRTIHERGFSLAGNVPVCTSWSKHSSSKAVSQKHALRWLRRRLCLMNVCTPSSRSRRTVPSVTPQRAAISITHVCLWDCFTAYSSCRQWPARPIHHTPARRSCSGTCAWFRTPNDGHRVPRSSACVLVHRSRHRMQGAQVKLASQPHFLGAIRSCIP